MADDLHGFINTIGEVSGELLTVEREVEPDFETTAIAFECAKLPSNPAVLFKMVSGSPFPFVTNVLGSHRRIAMAMHAPPDSNIYELWCLRTRQLVKPKIVDAGPVHDVIYEGTRVDLNKLPIHRHFEQDNGRYITNSIMVAKDPDTGIRNLSYSRAQLVGPNKMRNSLHSRGHLWLIQKKAEKMNKPLEVAIIVGAHPSVLLGAATRFVPLGLDECEIAGALLGKPLELVRCKTVDLEVPASAEIVIEGEILPDVHEDEGPFGEYTGYASGRSTRNVLLVKAITHRSDALYEDVVSGNSSEHVLLTGLMKQAEVFRKAKEVIPTVKNLYWPSSGVNYVCYVQLSEPVEEGQAKWAGALVLGLDSYTKIVVVVNEDIDILDERELTWAMATRVNPGVDINTLSNVFCNRLDPSASEAGTNGKLIVDATKKRGGIYTKLTLPPEIREKASAKIQEAMQASRHS